MLSKTKLAVGDVLEVAPRIRMGSGVGPGGDRDLDALTITEEPGGILTGRAWSVPSGTHLRLVTMPRKREGVNTAEVSVVGEPEVQGHVYWCELRASTRRLTPEEEAEIEAKVDATSPAP